MFRWRVDVSTQEENDCIKCIVNLHVEVLSELQRSTCICVSILNRYKIKEQYHTRKSFGGGNNSKVEIEYEAMGNAEMSTLRREIHTITNE